MLALSLLLSVCLVQDLSPWTSAAHIYGCGCVTISSEIQKFHPAGELSEPRGEQQKQLQELPETDQICWAPPCQGQQSPAAKKTFRQKDLPRRRLDQPRHLERTHSPIW